MRLWFKSRRQKAMEAAARACADIADARRRRDTRDLHKAREALTAAQHERLRVGA